MDEDGGEGKRDGERQGRRKRKAVGERFIRGDRGEMERDGRKRKRGIGGKEI